MAEQDVGPIDYLALEFPQAKITGAGMAALLELVGRGIIRILDLRFAVRAEDGSFMAVALADLDGDGKLDLAVFEGAQSGLLDDDDLAQAAGLVAPASAEASWSTRTPGPDRSSPQCETPGPMWWRAVGSRPPTSSPRWITWNQQTPDDLRTTLTTTRQ